jgi:hypothetical protein
MAYTEAYMVDGGAALGSGQRDGLLLALERRRLAIHAVQTIDEPGVAVSVPTTYIPPKLKIACVVDPPPQPFLKRLSGTNARGMTGIAPGHAQGRRTGPAAFHIRTQGRFVPDPPVPDLSKSGRDRPIAGIKAKAAAKAARRGDAGTSMSLQAHVVPRNDCRAANSYGRRQAGGTIALHVPQPFTVPDRAAEVTYFFPDRNLSHIVSSETYIPEENEEVERLLDLWRQGQESQGKDPTASGASILRTSPGYSGPP